MLARLVVAMVLSSAAALAAEPDVAGCTDHPLLTRLAGYRIVRCKLVEFDALEFRDATGRVGSVEGKLTQIVYGLPEGATGRSTVQVIRNYKDAFETKGGSLVFLNSDGALAYLTATKAGQPLWAVVNAYNPAGVVLTVVESEAMRQDVVADVDPRLGGAPERRSTLDPDRPPPPTSDWTPPDLDATANPVPMEELILVGEGWERDSP